MQTEVSLLIRQESYPVAYFCCHQPDLCNSAHLPVNVHYGQSGQGK